MLRSGYLFLPLADCQVLRREIPARRVRSLGVVVVDRLRPRWRVARKLSGSRSHRWCCFRWSWNDSCRPLTSGRFFRVRHRSTPHSFARSRNRFAMNCAPRSVTSTVPGACRGLGNGFATALSTTENAPAAPQVGQHSQCTTSRVQASRRAINGHGPKSVGSTSVRSVYQGSFGRSALRRPVGGRLGRGTCAGRRSPSTAFRRLTRFRLTERPVRRSVAQIRR